MIMPHTKFGIWSVGFIAVCIICFSIFYLFVASGYRGGDTFFSNPALAIPITFAGLSGAFAFITGIFAIAKEREHSVLVYVSVFLGALVTFFMAGELLSSH